MLHTKPLFRKHMAQLVDVSCAGQSSSSQQAASAKHAFHAGDLLPQQ
jgi:hypothetical protein